MFGRTTTPPMSKRMAFGGLDVEDMLYKVPESVQLHSEGIMEDCRASSRSAIEEA